MKSARQTLVSVPYLLQGYYLMLNRSDPSEDNPTTEVDAEFLNRIATELECHLTKDDLDRLYSLAKRGAETQWRPLIDAPEGEIEVLAFREDAGVFTAFRAEVHALGAATAEHAIIWYSTNGEDLTADLPTHFIALESLDLPSGDTG